jgi:hypothetical protein
MASAMLQAKKAATKTNVIVPKQANAAAPQVNNIPLNFFFSIWVVWV